MIRILFDHQIFSMQRYGGISRYFAHLYQSINKLDYIQSDISILRSSNYYVPNPSSPFNLVIGNAFLKKESRSFKLNKWYSKYRISKNDYDILHPTYHHPYFLKYIKKPYVITIHDMIHELFPEYFDTGDIYVKYKRECIENAAHIIAISNSTKEDIIKVLGIEDSRISVVHHGFDPNLMLPINLSDSKKTTDYLLFVGDRRGYKNFPRLVRAIVPLLKQNPSLELVCVGGGPFLAAEIELLLRFKVQHQVRQRSVADEQLANLYKNALAFVYPSLYEGFGLPILEAFQNDCPVIGSNTKCFKEIGQDAMKYFDPYDEHDILTTVQQVISSSDVAKKLVQNGRKQLLKFPMRLCVDKTIAVYKKV